MKSTITVFLLGTSVLLTGISTLQIRSASAQVQCDPSLGPCAGSKKLGKVNKEKWPSFDALCEGQSCKLILTNEYIQIGGTRLPREIVASYTMEDKSDYGCTVNGRPCNAILLGTIYYNDPNSDKKEAATFEFRNVKPVIKLNKEMKDWLGDQ